MRILVTGVRVYDPGTAAGAAALGLAAELMSAIDTEQLELAFQPQFSISTGKIIGVEALARWDRPGHGPVPPSEFIPLAEQTGLIHSLTHLTLRRALDEVQTWRRHGADIPVSVNLSGLMATDRALPEQINSMLAERGLDPSALVLEITETAAIRDRDGALEVLHQLRAIGVRVELDDFGSGYASFAALHHLPLDGVKLDRSLITNQSPGDTRLLAGTIEFARRLGLKVIVEGIEDAATLDLVRATHRPSTPLKPPHTRRLRSPLEHADHPVSNHARRRPQRAAKTGRSRHDRAGGAGVCNDPPARVASGARSPGTLVARGGLLIVCCRRSASRGCRNLLVEGQ